MYKAIFIYNDIVMKKYKNYTRQADISFYAIQFWH